MSNLSSALDILANIADSADDFDTLKRAAREQTGLEIDGLYCLHTGKLIGRFDRLEIEEAIFEEGDADEESLIDALVVRVVASMRPSPALNKPDMGTIREMSQRRPIDALAYLVNRLYGNQHLLRNRTDDAFSLLRNRISIHNQIAALYENGLDLAPFTHWLLELDSKMNLHSVTPPDFDIFANLDNFEKWVFTKLDAARMLEVNAAKEASWHQGNRLTRAASIRSHLDNPEIANRKHAAAYAAKKKAAAAAAAGKPVRKRATQVDQFMGMLDDLINNAGGISEPVTPTKPKAMTVGMLFKKKES